MTSQGATRRCRPVVAIDGPAGAGKSTVSQRVADALGYLRLDTGALYRSVALAVSRAEASSPAEMAAVAQRLVRGQGIRLDRGAAVQSVFLDGEDVTEEIRTQEVAHLASQVSTVPEVRRELLELQRQAGAEGGVVVEGRDIGSVVFPDAEAKFFLTASVEARAGRRFTELKEKEPDVSLARVEEEVRERDRRDSCRPIAPLKQSPDATLVDSTGLSIDEVVTQIVDAVRRVEYNMNASSTPEHGGS